MSDIAIIGGGIGGLAAALALLRRGIDVDVYEQASALKEIGAGVQVGPNGTRVLQALGVADALKRNEVVASGKEIRLWNTGQTWTLFDLGEESIARYGAPYIMLHRGDLHAVLAAAISALKPDAIRLGMKCAAVEQSAGRATIAFESGDNIEAKAVIGADGIHSRVRDSLFGKDQPEFSGIVAWRGMVPKARVPDGIKMTVATNWVGPGAHIVHYPVRGGELLNFVGIVENNEWQVESWTEPGSKADLHKQFDGWHADIHATIDEFDVPYKWALMHRAPMDRWSAGCVTLLGDACHSMMPMLAQGACQALEDGMVVARCLEKYPDATTAFRHYENARRERANRAVQGSADNAKRFHNQQMADAKQADAYVSREWQPDKIKARYDWLFEYDAASVSV
jgi:salicylate hydroxylase